MYSQAGVCLVSRECGFKFPPSFAHTVQHLLSLSFSLSSLSLSFSLSLFLFLSLSLSLYIT